MARTVCPTCDAEFDTATTPAMPFCSVRCRTIDLGRWLSEGYGVPAISRSDEEFGEFDFEET